MLCLEKKLRGSGFRSSAGRCCCCCCCYSRSHLCFICLFVCLLQPSVLKSVFVGVVTLVFVVALCVCVCVYLSLSLSLSSELEELGACGLFVFQGIEEWQLCPE